MPRGRLLTPLQPLWCLVHTNVHGPGASWLYDDVIRQVLRQHLPA